MLETRVFPAVAIGMVVLLVFAIAQLRHSEETAFLSPDAKELANAG